MFKGCKNLKRVELNEGFTVLGPSDDDDLYGIVAMHNGVFQYSGLEEITLPRTLRCIYEFTFCNCENLRLVLVEVGCQIDVQSHVG